jgi:hypothetical protein
MDTRKRPRNARWRMFQFMTPRPWLLIRKGAAEPARSRRNEGIRASQLRFDLLWLRSGMRGCEWLVVMVSKS